jgi:anaerobic ribonucleoside-triphosphate reductase activating protein
MLEFKDNQVVAVEELARNILSIRGIGGITFSGGEPFAQAASLAELAECLALQGLTITVFTGYTYHELRTAANPGWDRLLAAADLLIAGPYIKEHPSQNYLLGSANQELIFLTERLKDHPEITNNAGHAREFTIDVAGNVVISGLG